MLEKIIFFDLAITFFLKNLLPQNYFFDLFFSFFSLKGNAIFVWILVIIVILIFEERENPGITKKDKQFIVVFTLTFLITSLVVTYPLKNFFKRPRPISNNSNQWQFTLQIKETLSTNCPTDFSFPSSHASTAFAASTVLTFFDKKRRVFYYLIAFIIAYSRIYLGCHYFLDVLGGGILGIIISKIILNILHHLKKPIF